MFEKKVQFCVFLFLVYIMSFYSCKSPTKLPNENPPEPSSSAPNILWTKTFGGGAGEQANSVQQTNDGGFVILGSTLSFGNGQFDAWMVKTDDNGNETWNKFFGGAEIDGPASIQQTSDGGYVFTGLTYSYGDSEGDCWVVKTDENGNELWNKTFGGPGHDRAQSIIQLPGGDYMMTGGTYSYGDGDIWLVKIDGDGEEIWSRTYGGAGDQKAYTVLQTPDGGFVLAGFTDPSSNLLLDILLLKTDGNGNQIWTQTFGGSNIDNAYSCQLTTDGGFILAGYTKSFGNGQEDIWLIKTDSNGNEVWNKTFGGTGRDITYSASQTVDGGYIIGGYTDSKGNGQNDIWFIKTDQNGNLVWDKTSGGSLNELAFAVLQTNNGRYIAVGETNSSGNGESDFYVVLLNSE